MMILECSICGNSLESKAHQEHCPQGILTALENWLGERAANCPECRAGRVRFSREDFAECENCHLRWTTGEAFVKDATVTHVLDFATGPMVPAVLMDGKGEGRFPFDQDRKMLRDKIAEIRGKD